MRRSLTPAIALVLVFSSIGFGASHVARQDSSGEREHRLNDHPLAQPVASHDVKIEIVHDRILRSCCRPPDLVVSGKVVNVTPRAIGYVRILIAMKDGDGHVVYAEDTYNHGAVTLFEDPEIAKILNEKPHADPIAPGASDTFVFSIPMPMIPRYKSTQVLAAEVVRNPPLTSRQ
jgi:hypothetical protein